MTVLVLTHQDDAGPGNLLPWFARAGLTAQVCTVPDDGVPGPDGWDALVVLGSRETATDPRVTWAAPERDLISRCVSTGTPVFGICFGAQQLALALGGRVERMAAPEFGWTVVDGEVPVAGEWFSWHQDHVTSLPPGAVALARSARSLQAFRYGPHLGVQFHPETTAARIADWIDQASRMDRLVDAGGDVAALRSRTAQVLPAAGAAAGTLYSHALGHLTAR